MFDEEDLAAPHLLQDHPINLKSPELLEQPELLPQMRFLLNRTPLLEIAFQLMFASCRLGNYSQTDRSKMESTLETFASQFFRLDAARIVRQSKRLVGITEKEVVLLLRGNDAYYSAKKNEDYAFQESWQLGETRSAAQ